jgi:hypothetical protein
MGMFTQNSKMKKSGKKHKVKIVNFTLPALKSVTGMVICVNADKCATGCYARQGAYRFSNVAKKHEENLQATLHDLFVTAAIAELSKFKANFVRIHDSGDFYSVDYLNKWIAIARAMPTVKFYAYTKMVSMVKSVKLPDNMTIIFSFGGKEDKLILSSDRHSRVFETIDELNASSYIDASSDDMLALTANPLIGLVYHGGKNYANTNWNKVIVKTA